MTRLYLKTPSSARARAIFSPGKDGEAGDVGFIVDAAGCSQAKKGPLEARSSFLTEPSILPGIQRFNKVRSPSMVGAVMRMPPVVCKYRGDSLQVYPQHLEALKRA